MTWRYALLVCLLAAACGRDKVTLSIEPAPSCEGGCSIQMDCLEYIEAVFYGAEPEYEFLGVECANVTGRDVFTLCDHDLAGALRADIPDGAEFFNITGFGPGFDGCGGPPLFMASATLEEIPSVIQAEAACNLSCATLADREYPLRLEDSETGAEPPNVEAFRVEVGLMFDVDAIGDPEAAGFVAFEPFAAGHEPIEANAEVVVAGITYDVPEGSRRCVAARIVSGDAQLPSLSCIHYDPEPDEPQRVLWLPPGTQNLVESFLRDHGRDPQLGYVLGQIGDDVGPIEGAIIGGLPPTEDDLVAVFYEIDEALQPVEGTFDGTGPGGMFIISGPFVGQLTFEAPGHLLGSDTVGMSPGHSSVLPVYLELE